MIIEKSVETGVSSNLETTISLIEDTYERSKTFGNGYFVSNGGFVSAPVFTIEIGVNNPTSVSVVYGLIHDTATTATEVQCGMEFYDENGRVDDTGTSGTQLNQDLSFTWTKEENAEFTARRVKIRVAALGGSGEVSYAEPLYIKSISLTWSC